jgi:polyhydroxyalkanoate synthesis regulator phasin
MAKKAKKKSKKDTPADAVGAVRTAVERTFQATADSAQSTRTRAQDLVDEVAGAAGRVREMIEDIRVLEDLKGLRTEVEALRTRVAALERSTPAKPARSRSSTASRSTTKRKPAAASKTARTKRSTAPKKRAS